MLFALNMIELAMVLPILLALLLVLAATPYIAISPPSGRDGFAYVNTSVGPSMASPTWTVFDNIMDLDIDIDIVDFKATIRRTGGVNVYMPTMKDWGVKFKMIWDHTDTLCGYIRTAYLNRQALDMIFLDGAVATAGNEGPRANWMVGKMSRTEHLEDGMTIDVELKPALTANANSTYLTWFTAA